MKSPHELLKELYEAREEARRLKKIANDIFIASYDPKTDDRSHYSQEYIEYRNAADRAGAALRACLRYGKEVPK